MLGTVIHILWLWKLMKKKNIHVSAKWLQNSLWEIPPVWKLLAFDSNDSQTLDIQVTFWFWMVKIHWILGWRWKHALQKKESYFNRDVIWIVEIEHSQLTYEKLKSLMPSLMLQNEYILCVKIVNDPLLSHKKSHQIICKSVEKTKK